MSDIILKVYPYVLVGLYFFVFGVLNVLFFVNALFSDDVVGWEDFRRVLLPITLWPFVLVIVICFVIRDFIISQYRKWKRGR